MEYVLNCFDDEGCDLPTAFLVDKVIAFVKKKEQDLLLKPDRKVIVWCPCRDMPNSFGGRAWTTSDWLYDILQWNLKDRFTVCLRNYCYDKSYKFLYIQAIT